MQQVLGSTVCNLVMLKITNFPHILLAIHSRGYRTTPYYYFLDRIYLSIYPWMARRGKINLKSRLV